MTSLPKNIVKCSVCGRYYGYAWEAERPGARRAALLTGWLQVGGLWYCYTTPGCQVPVIRALNEDSSGRQAPEI